MTKLSVLEELDAALSAEARSADPAESSRELAERFLDAASSLVEHFDREWKVEKLTRLFIQKRAKLRWARDPQRRLGFKPIRKKFTLKSGEEFSELDANLWRLRQLYKELGEEEHPLRPEVKRRIDFLAPFAKQKRGIKLGVAYEKAAAKLPGMEE